MSSSSMPTLAQANLGAARISSKKLWSPGRGSWVTRASVAAAAVGAVVMLTGVARADVVTLLDNTQVAGKLTHYYNGMLEVEMTNGQRMELPKDKIKAITFKLPAPRAEFSSPEKVFERWRVSMQKGDVQKAIDCYALMYQGMMTQQMMASPDELKKAQKDLEGVSFEAKGATFQNQGENKLATLKVRRTKGENVQTDDVHLVLENGEWKMTP